MELELTYWECLALLGIENEAEARDFEGFCFDRDNGVTVIVESYADGNPMMTPAEMADLLRLYPQVQRGEPVLIFPVKWPEFARFIEANGMTGYVDGIKAVNWLLSQDCGRSSATEPASTNPRTGSRADAERNHKALVGLLTLALTKRAGPSFRHTTRGREGPNLSAVAADLLSVAEAEGLDTDGLSPKSLTNRLADGQAELEERR